jgi:hypothetical protein
MKLEHQLRVGRRLRTWLCGSFFLGKLELNMENNFDHGLGSRLLDWIVRVMVAEKLAKRGKSKAM